MIAPPGDCPECKGPLKVITYGLPTAAALDDPDFVSGGCCVFEDSPRFHCDSCDKDF